MELTADIWVYGIWCVLGPDGNFLCTLYQKADGTKEIECRTRYYAQTPELPDDKTFYRLALPRTLDWEQLRAATETMAQEVAALHLWPQQDFILCECSGTDEKIFNALKSKPWVQMTKEEKHEQSH